MGTDEFTNGFLNAIKDDERVCNLTKVINDEFGGLLEHEKIACLLEAQGDLWHKQDDLRREFETGSISSENYLACLKHALQQAMVKSEAILGSADFHRLFGDAGYNPHNIIDSNKFHRQQRKIE